MIYTESEMVELKSVYVDSIKKEIVAFANTHGGTIYIGVEDDGEVCGIDHTDLVTQQVMNAARDAIKPDVTMFMHIESISENGKLILAVLKPRKWRTETICTACLLQLPLLFQLLLQLSLS